MNKKAFYIITLLLAYAILFTIADNNKRVEVRTEVVEVEVTREVVREVRVEVPVAYTNIPTPTSTPTPTATSTPTVTPTSTSTPTPTVNPNPTMRPLEEVVEERLEGRGKFLLDVENIQQNPELPNGCEGTSMTIVLNYLGIKANKVDVATNWIKRGESRVANPWFEYPGDPRNNSGYGCYMPVVVDALTKKFEEFGISSDYRIEQNYNLSINELCDMLEDGYPIMVISSIDAKAIKRISHWTDKNGNTVEWRSNMHFLVLVGYDKDNNKLAFADPMKDSKVTWYDATEWSKHYQERNSQSGRVITN